MSIGELLTTLQDLRISLDLDEEGKSLIIKANKGAINEEIKASLVENREELIAFLRSTSRVTPSAHEKEGHTNQNIALLTPESLPLIDLTQEDIDLIVAQVPGGVANIQDIYALSPSQEGILFHHVMNTAGDPYLIRTMLSFANRPLLDRFFSAVQKVVDRHDILRTSFIWNGISSPAQVVWRKAQVTIDDFKFDPAAGSIEEQLAGRFDPRRHHIDLGRAPLLHFAAAYDPDHDRWLILQTLHHLVGDHSTLELLKSEVAALLGGQEDTLPAPKSFRSLVVQSRLGATVEEHERFFRKTLGDVDEPTLAFGIGDIYQDGGDIAESRQTLPHDLNDRLRRQARRLGVSLASLCHVAWGQILARITGNDTVICGTVLLGRMQGGAAEAVGLFINTLPMRLDLGEIATERTVQQTHVRLADLMAHEHASLALAQRCTISGSSTPLFNTVLNYRYGAFATEDRTTFANDHPLAGIEVLRSEVRNNYPITMSVDDYGDSLGLVALVTRSVSAERICGYMQQALESLAVTLETAPQMLVSLIDVIPPEERELLLEKWNATTSPFADNSCIHQLFEEQAQLTPEAPALVSGDETLSYAELNRQANRLAHHLIKLGVRPDDRIAICVDRSPAMVIGLLAILKAGGAYVPLDPAYPSERLAQVLDDAAPRALLCDARGRGVLGGAASDALVVLDLDVPRSAWSSEAENDPQVAGLTSRHLAYVIYTSGSTGTPKGVMVEHRSAMNFHQAMTHSIYHDFSSPLRIGWNASFSFDMSLKGFLQLLSGHCLVIIPQQVRTSGAEMMVFLRQQQIDAFDTTPSQLKLLIAEGLLEDSHPRTVLLGGELVDGTMWAELSNGGSVTAYNMYGPTECTVDATITPITDADETPHIGSPIMNTRIYLLDSHRQPVPLGAVGEMYIGGAGVARGYLNRPDLTAERFLTDPFSTEPGARIYKTGDLARYLPDGNLVFMGRNDQQVKIRGFRIELGEIEARLAEHPHVERVVVIAREDTFGDKRLAAYYTGDASLTAEQLREYLAALLPEYMVPATFMHLEALPLTPNGKLDRKALPAPEGDAYASQAYEPPQGETETALAEIWKELLHVERVGRNDNFFELGGHSLLAIQLIQRLRQRGLNLEIRILFTTPKLVDLAASLHQSAAFAIPQNLIQPESGIITPDMLPLINLTQDDIDHIVEQVPGGIANIQDIYALSPSQEGILFHHIMADSGDPYLMSTELGFRDMVLLDRFLWAVQQVVDRHDILRTSFIWKGLSVPAQVVWRHAQLSVTELELNPSDGRIADQLAALFDPRSQNMDLTKAPLLQFFIAHDPEHNRWILLRRLHHLVGDQSTLHLLRAEVAALISGTQQAFAPPVPFRNLVAQSRLGVSVEEHERFFRDMLGDLTEPTLPFGISNVHQDGSNITEARQILPGHLNGRLRQQAKRLHVSMASLCHLAWAQVLASITSTDRVVFGTVLFGRMQESERTDQAIGLLVNTLPISVDLNGIDTGEALRKVHSSLAELLAHEHASLALAQRCSGIEAPTPLFSAVFNYRYGDQVTSADTQSSSALMEIELLGHEWRTNYPLTLSVEDFGNALGLLALALEPVSSERICAYTLETLENIAQALETGSQTPVRRINIIPSEERELLLEAWNRTPAPSADNRCIHQVFEEQVRRSPDAAALTFNDATLSYVELNRRANRLAHYLMELGIGPDDRVAICLDRSPMMIIGLLAILKAGGAYVPLDPAYPSERLSQILSDAAPRVLLCDALGRGVLGSETTRGLIVVELDAPDLVWAAHPDTDPQVLDLNRHHLAYVIYTSGSTGTPKGVMVEHAQIIRLFDVTQDSYGFNDRDVWCLFHSFAFDFSVWEIWGALYYGSRLVIVPYEVARSSQDFYRLVCEQQVTVLNQTPSAFRALMEAEAESNLSDRLRYVIFGGEALDPTILRSWYRRRSERQPLLVNMYGITETTVHVTYRSLMASDTVTSASPIGKRLADLRIYLLDNHRQPVPLGAVGEMYVGGGGVARGYLNRPELTAERFLPDPFCDAPEARMYRTGDLARYLPAGDLEFLGRNDQQVKIRGFRIELGEIEVRLAEHPLVEQALVIVLEKTQGDKRLVAYHTGDASLTAEQLRAHLVALLPEYMVPSAFMHLEALPLTPNGKLDRKALPAPEGDAYTTRAYEPPQGDTEIALAEIWKELLHLERVGRNDNFFELGGHSLLAIQVIERLRRLDLSLEIRSLFTRPVLRDAAAMAGHDNSAAVPPNQILPSNNVITPEMLPLIELTQQDIDRIAQQVPGGIANIQDIYALSALQEGILFHYLFTDEGDPYVLSAQISFANRSLLDRFLRAVQQVIDRHDILRTSFVWKGISGPAQVVWRQAQLQVTELEPDPRQGTVEEQLTRLFDPGRYRMDLTRAPLLQFVIAREIGGSRWFALHLRHHLIEDAGSVQVLRAEIEAMMEGRGETLPPAEPFRAFVAQSHGVDLPGAHEEFFKEMLGQVSEPTFPFGLNNVYQHGHKVSRSQIKLPPELNDLLRLQARRLGVTLASLCHLAWGQVLARCSSSERVVFGTVLFGRMHGREGVSQAVGMFINTLPIVLDLDMQGAGVAIERTHFRLAELLKHEHASLAFVQRCSGIEAPTPLFSTVLNYRHNPISAREYRLDEKHPFKGIEWKMGENRTNYPIVLSVDDFSDSLELTSEVLAPVSSERICDYMRQALESLADALETAPKTPVCKLEVIPPAERKLLLEIWNATEAPYPENLCIHQLFEEQVRKSPDAKALIFKGGSLTYTELNSRANRLAHYLIELNVRPDDRVAICVDRGPTMVVGLLAILKAGGAYVPLDPAYPSERLVRALRDAAPRVLLCDAHGRKVLGSSLVDELIMLDLDDPLPAWSRHVEVDPDPATLGLTSQHLAYVIYTSGSTGTPKGVMNEHRALINRLVWMQNAYSLTSSDVVLQKTSFSFDVSVWEFFWTLMAGATLALTPPGEQADPERLIHLICDWKVTTAHFVPSVLNVFIHTPGVERCTCLRQIICSGETLSPAQVKACFEQLPRLWLQNLYGPTEAAIDVTAWSCPSGFDSAIVPIGRPIANTRIYLLDSQHQLVPLGAAGEIYIGGVGVARGYLNRPDLTAERFLPDPFCGEPGTRMYRTGDLARYLPDGNLEFLGRNDQQVKIRGFRIELGEIEARLVEHPLIEQAVVIAKKDTSEDKRLVAYYTTSASKDISAEHLRMYIATLLPEYMVPSAFVHLEALPLTPNGKLDRKALPAPEGDAYASHAYEPPYGETEIVLAEIWKELLHVERVGRNDNFFHLGGHSLLAVRLLSRLAQNFELHIPLTELFAAPTLVQMGTAIDGRRLQGDQQSLPSISRLPDGVKLPLSYGQQRLWFLSQLEGASPVYHIPMAVRLRGDLDTSVLRYSLDTIFARHEALRSIFVTVEGGPAVELLPEAMGLPLSEIDLSDKTDTQGQLIKLYKQQVRTPFDLSRGPLLRACLVRLGDEEHVLILVQHHIVSDGWSMGVLVNELSILYSTYLRGEPNPLPPLEIQYPDYAAWQRKWLAGERLEAQADYWKRTLADAPPLLDLPTDRPRPAQQSFAGAFVPVRINAELTRKLKALSTKHGTTLFMTLLAAWAAVLSRLSGQDDVVIGTPVANRRHVQVENLIGFFVNTLALRIDLGGEPTVEELLRRVRVATLEAQDHQDLPFEQVVEIVNPPRRLDSTPLFQVMFAWQNEQHNPPTLAGLQVESFGISHTNARFDLELALSENDGEVVGSLTYSTALFDEATATRYAGYLLTLLAEATADSQRPIGAVKLLAQDERKLLLETWNATEAPYADSLCIHQLFEEQVRKNPDAKALIFK
ncbi:non-ribosomal peptide synthetase, partial [Edaphobacter dinghuensis]